MSINKNEIYQRILLINSNNNNQLHDEMLSDFQKENFKLYHENPFSLTMSAVLVCLFERNNKLHTILLERVKLGKHSGEICFPGGKHEPNDSDIIDTALRETHEEIGISVGRNRVLGNLSNVKIPVSKFEVVPVVAYTEEMHNFTISKSEISEVFCVDIEQLATSFDNREIMVKDIKYTVPSFACEGKIIWGATAMIINELLYILDKK